MNEIDEFYIFYRKAGAEFGDILRLPGQVLIDELKGIDKLEIMLDCVGNPQEVARIISRSRG